MGNLSLNINIMKLKFLFANLGCKSNASCCDQENRMENYRARVQIQAEIIGLQTTNILWLLSGLTEKR